MKLAAGKKPELKQTFMKTMKESKWRAKEESLRKYNSLIIKLYQPGTLEDLVEGLERLPVEGED